MPGGARAHAPSGRTAPASVRRGDVLAVAAGGAIGGALRYGLGVAVPAHPGALPVATLAENVIGAFALGVVVTLLARSRHGAAAHLPVGPFLTTGILGSFTTFSTFTWELVALESASAGGVALLYALASVCLGLVAAIAGVGTARALTPGRP